MSEITLYIWTMTLQEYLLQFHTANPTRSKIESEKIKFLSNFSNLLSINIEKTKNRKLIEKLHFNPPKMAFL